MTEFAHQGSVFARDVELAAADPVKNLQKLNELSKKIEEIDEHIICLGETFREIVTLAHMFSFEKDSMHGARVGDLARQTDLVYRKMINRCGILKKIGNKLFYNLYASDEIMKQKIA